MDHRDYLMQATVQAGGSVALEGLPFATGARVEVVIRPQSSGSPPLESRYPLRGTPAIFFEPTAPVGTQDWEATS